MCNINFIYRKSEKESKRIADLMNAISFNSFNHNSDGEGFFLKGNNKNLFGKSKTKIIFNEPAYLFITHQRLSTSGHNKNNIHPHQKNGFLLFHNGIFSGLGNEKASDTAQYFQKLLKIYDKNKNIIKSIKELNNKISGSYSIVLIDLNKDKYYYYKNNSTSFYKLENKNYIIGSTIKENIQYAKSYLKIKGSIKEVKHGIIYDLLTFKRITSFKEASLFENFGQKTSVFDEKSAYFSEKTHNFTIKNENPHPNQDENASKKEMILNELENIGFDIITNDENNFVKAVISKPILKKYQRLFYRIHKQKDLSYLVVFNLDDFGFILDGFNYHYKENFYPYLE